MFLGMRQFAVEHRKGDRRQPTFGGENQNVIVDIMIFVLLYTLTSKL
jgi:hypothetical protein